MRKRFSPMDFTSFNFFAIFVNLSLFCGLFIIFVSTLTAGEIEKNFGEYLEFLSPDEFVSAIVIMADQAEIKALNVSLKAEKATMRVRHQRVISALKAAASRSQGDIVDYLEAKKEEGLVKGYTRYWIMNLIVVQCTKEELEKIAARVDVEIVEENFKVSLIEPVGDRAGSVQIPPKGIGVTPGLRAINADRVWYELGITGLGRLVANMDTGVDGDHPALTNRWRGNHEPWQECWRDALGGGTTYPVDYYGHGTHVMGTMCGLGVATVDTIGVAWEAEWIADNSINQGVGPAFDNDVLGAFEWFTDPDGDPGTTDDVPDVLQNSWGIDGRFGYDYEDCDYRWRAVIKNCEAAGVVCIFSAGNEGPDPMTHRSPANICVTPTTNFSIGAVDATNYDFPYPIADFSSRGPSDCDGITKKPEVVAPGVQVYSSVPGGGYEQYGWDGTSMAGPHVAGVVALLRQANPDLDVDSIKQVLMNTAVDLGLPGEENTFGWGVIDAYEAVLAVMPSLSCGISVRLVDPPSFYDPPIKVAPDDFRFVTLELAGLYNWGGDYEVTSDHPKVTCVTNCAGYLSPGELREVELQIDCAGEEDFIAATITIRGCIGTEDEDTIQVTLHAVCSNDYYECPFDPRTWILKDNCKCSLWVCCNTEQRVWDKRLEDPDGETIQPIFSSGVIVATTAGNDTVVGRQDYSDTRTGARDTLRHVVGSMEPYFPAEPCTIQKIHCTKTFICANNLRPPESYNHDKWWWISINKQIIMFHGPDCPNWKKEQIIKYVWIEYGDLPGWWPDQTPYVEHEDIYVGIFADIDAPYDYGCPACNTAGWDDARQMIWQHGYSDGTHPEYEDYYVGLVLTDPSGAVVSPWGCQNVLNEEYLWPQHGWGWLEGELYQLAATPGVNIHNPGEVHDRTVVMTADMIPAGTEDDFQSEFILIEAFIPTGLADLQAHIDDTRNILILELNDLGLFSKQFPICGDANNDRVINIADVVYVVTYLFLNGPPPSWPMNRADANGDEVVNIADAVYLVTYLFLNGPPPDCSGFGR